MAEKQEKELKYFVRIVNTDLDGKKSLLQSLQKIKGIGPMYSHAICQVAKVDENLKAGYLNDTQISAITSVIEDPLKHNIPSWMLNRRKDKEDGKDKHLVTADLRFTQENDIKLEKKIKSYTGVRHYSNLPVRGQRTKSNFRRNKGKVTGVKKGAQKGKK